MNNYIYLYDGTFLNLLNNIEYLILNKIKPVNIKNEFTYEENLIDKTFKATTKNSTDFIDEIINKTSVQVFNIVYNLFLSEEENKELIIFYLLLNGFKYGSKVIYLRNLNCVNKALKINNYVKRENHKFKGFIRFKEINNKFLYAQMEPTNNIIFLLAKHFSKRLKNENWVIRDVKRDIYCIYINGNYRFIGGEFIDFDKFIYSEKEEFYEGLWKSFYNTIGISSRKNDRCRMNFMPKKYWKYIIEMEDIK